MTRLRTAAIAGLLAFTAAGAAQADDPIKAATEYRQAMFQTFKWQMGQLAAMAKGERAYDAAMAEAAADAMVAHGVLMPAAFPEGSANDEALPEIWTDASGFAEAVDQFQTAVASLSEIADDGREEMAGGLRAVGASCKNCHDNYRD